MKRIYTLIVLFVPYLFCVQSYAHVPGAENALRVMVWNVLHGSNDVTNGAE